MDILDIRLNFLCLTLSLVFSCRLVFSCSYLLPVINYYVSLSIFNHIEQVFSYFHSLSCMLLTTHNYYWKDYILFSIISCAGRSCFNYIYVMLKVSIKCCPLYRNMVPMGCELFWHLLLRRLLTISVRYHYMNLFYVLKFYNLCNQSTLTESCLGIYWKYSSHLRCNLHCRKLLCLQRLSYEKYIK